MPRPEHSLGRLKCSSRIGATSSTRDLLTNGSSDGQGDAEELKDPRRVEPDDRQEDRAEVDQGLSAIPNDPDSGESGAQHEDRVAEALAFLVVVHFELAREWVRREPPQDILSKRLRHGSSRAALLTPRT